MEREEAKWGEINKEDCGIVTNFEDRARPEQPFNYYIIIEKANPLNSIGAVV